MSYSDHSSARGQTPQGAPLPGREAEMKVNNAGGVVFTVDAFERLRRFLILGSDTSTYYVNAKELTLDNIDGVLAALREDGVRVVREIVAISQ